MNRQALLLALALLGGCDRSYYRVQNAMSHGVLARITCSDGLTREVCMPSLHPVDTLDPLLRVRRIEVFYQGRLLYAADEA
jgi:hypothetical protein